MLSQSLCIASHGSGRTAAPTAQGRKEVCVSGRTGAGPQRGALASLRVLATILLAVTGVLSAQGSGARRILVLTASADGPAEARLASILEEAAALELGNQGYDVHAVPREAADLLDLVDDRGRLRLEVLGQLAAEAVAARLVLLKYARSQEQLRLDISSHLPGTGEQTGAVTETGSLGLDVDEIVARGVRSLDQAIGSDSGPPAVVATTALASPAALTLPDPPVATDSPVLRPDIIPTPAPGHRISQAASVSRGHVFVGVAPFFTTGRAGRYFTRGLVESLSVGYRLPILGDHFSLGLHVGTYTFDAAGEIASSRNAIIPAGPQIQIHAGDSGVLSAWLRLAGGPAVFLMTPNGVATLTKLTAYAHAGVGLSVMFLGSVGVGIEAGYTVFFEPYFPIGGFVPSVFVYMRR